MPPVQVRMTQQPASPPRPEAPSPAQPPQREKRMQRPAYDGDSLYDQPSPQAPATPLHLIPAILSKWFIMLIAAVVAAGGATMYGMSKKPFYMATSVIEMTIRRPRIMKQDDAVIDDAYWQNTTELLNTRLQILRGDAVRAMVLGILGSDHPSLNVSSQALESAIASANIMRQRDTRLVDISLTSLDSAVVVPVVNAYAKAAVQSVQTGLKQASEAAVAWLEQQAQAQQEKTRQIESEIQSYKRDNRSDSLEKEKSGFEQSLFTINQALMDVEGKATFSRSLLEILSNTNITVDGASRLPSSVPQKEDIQQCLRDLKAKTGEREVLLLRYTEEHPSVKKLSKMITSLRAQFETLLRQSRETADADLKLIEQQHERLTARKEDEQKRIADLARQIATLNPAIDELNRNLTVNQNTLRGITVRMEEARLSTEENTAIVTIVQEAKDYAVIRPHFMRTITLAGILGLMFGIGLAYIMVRFEDLVSTAAGIENEMMLPLIGIVPHVEAKRGSNDVYLASASDKLGIMAESFAKIRTIFETSQRDAAGKTAVVITVAAAGPAEGKTAVSCNLAISFAQSGHKTLLVDGDMRRPSIHHIFDIKGDTPDLTRALASDSADIRERLLQETAIPGLYLGCSKRQAENVSPADVLTQANLRRFMEWARKGFEYVVIDTPPIGIFGDALAFGSAGDTVLVTCRYDKSRKTAVKRSIEDLGRNGSRIEGLVLCDVPIRRLSYRLGYGGYYYGYHYDHYRYYDDYAKRPKKQ